jgi:hypothetical protein
MTQQDSSYTTGETGIWLPLVEYSLRSGVSLSTIRRKIKGNAIPFRLDKGKYLILFDGIPKIENQLPTLSSAHIVSTQSPKFFSAPRAISPAVQTVSPTATPMPPSIKPRDWIDATPRLPQNEFGQLPLVERAVKMVSDAFENTLKEKDQRIALLERRSRELEDRIEELQLLVKVLEEKYSVEY